MAKAQIRPRDTEAREPELVNVAELRSQLSQCLKEALRIRALIRKTTKARADAAAAAERVSKISLVDVHSRASDGMGKCTLMRITQDGI